MLLQDHQRRHHRRRLSDLFGTPVRRTTGVVGSFRGGVITRLYFSAHFPRVSERELGTFVHIAIWGLKVNSRQPKAYVFLGLDYVCGIFFERQRLCQSLFTPVLERNSAKHVERNATTLAVASYRKRVDVVPLRDMRFCRYGWERQHIL